MSEYAHAFGNWLYESSLSALVRGSDSLFTWVEGFHVLAITLVVGTIAVVDLRLLGVISRNRPVTKLVEELLPLTWGAFIAAALSGFTLFSSDPMNYLENFSFRAKLVLLGVVLVNMLIFHAVTYRGVRAWDDHSDTPCAAKLAGGASLLLWIGVVAFGRWIGFTLGG